MQETSLFAFKEAKENLAKKHKAVLAVFISGGEYTNSELAEHLKWPINCITPRVFELREMGRLEENAKRTCKITGRTAIAWRIRNDKLNPYAE